MHGADCLLNPFNVVLGATLIARNKLICRKVLFPNVLCVGLLGNPKQAKIQMHFRAVKPIVVFLPTLQDFNGDRIRRPVT